jgi:uncharacterized protein HemY
VTAPATGNRIAAAITKTEGLIGGMDADDRARMEEACTLEGGMRVQLASLATEGLLYQLMNAEEAQLMYAIWKDFDRRPLAERAVSMRVAAELLGVGGSR